MDGRKLKFWNMFGPLEGEAKEAIARFWIIVEVGYRSISLERVWGQKLGEARPGDLASSPS